MPIIDRIRHLTVPVVLLCLAACSGATPRIAPVLDAVDAVGHVAARALGWCVENDADPSKLASIAEAFAKKDYAPGFELLKATLAELRAARPNDPELEDVAASVVLAEQLLAAHASEQASRSLEPSGPDGGR